VAAGSVTLTVPGGRVVAAKRALVDPVLRAARATSVGEAPRGVRTARVVAATAETATSTTANGAVAAD
jgi:hypothetical protein